ncbi:hypothetical protein I3F58_28275 [Streptomyces sp. MUM 203J]|nr:potassium transporter TrkG [Streptomyces sp. MUM 203J]MCH0543377.1 hypothetical protein [Streptomyces sp. MUM 203J]
MATRYPARTAVIASVPGGTDRPLHHRLKRSVSPGSSSAPGRTGAGPAALSAAVSAFGTVGLSAGITGLLRVTGRLTVILLMFVGRPEPVTLVSAPAPLERTGRYQLPEERPVIG